MKFPWKKGNVNERKPEELVRLFRRVFLSEDGQEVLRLLLNDWSYFDICETEQKRVLNDYAKYFIHTYLGQAKITVYTELDRNREEDQ